MKSLNLPVAIAVSLVVACSSNAQEIDSTAAPIPTAEPQLESPEAKVYPLSVNAEVGTTGVGGTIGWRFLSHLGVRGGMHYLSYTTPDFDFEDDVSTTTFNARMYLQSEPVTLDIYPWKNSSFRISAGVLFNQNEFTGNATGNVEIDGTSYPGEQLKFKITQQEVCPYVGIGGNFVSFGRAKRWSLGGEIGVAYTDTWSIALTNPTGGIPQSELDKEQQDLQDEIKDFKFWPVLKLSLSYQF
jgi:hypothetical protein